MYIFLPQETVVPVAYIDASLMFGSHFNTYAKILSAKSANDRNENSSLAKL